MSNPSVLSNWSVGLDWITPEAELVVARHARVSTKKPDRHEYLKLLTYCIEHGHWSVLEQASASFEIVTSRDISAQIIRHRSFHFQEFSQRYSDPTDVLGEFETDCWDFELRDQDLKNRQNSVAPTDAVKVRVFKERLKILYSDIRNTYKDMLEAGIAKECARRILPMCSPTRLHMQGTLRDWIFYVGLRAAPGTQKEHQVIAKEIGRRLGEEVPTIISAVKCAAVLDKDRGLKGWQTLITEQQ